MYTHTLAHDSIFPVLLFVYDNCYIISNEVFLKSGHTTQEVFSLLNILEQSGSRSKQKLKNGLARHTT